ncbi:sodium- and chloride-dependent GABA transporter 1 isoform X1 [Nematostella vectensis]|uniref:sodium- and chloride-dependent GABA transporter 1 isoform X1 n=1 Tax=Nematostella vectensis TaxID=45351 RepID=UPI0020778105|nr:sodium- and chloride-dependent GABA transporter 1 isoform X1 [Nematostella vectensis]
MSEKGVEIEESNDTKKPLFGSTSSSEDSPQIDVEEEQTRDKWSSKAEFMLSSLGYCVGFGNVWRFPYLCYKNGGATFLIPYFIMLIVNGIPLFFLELAIGQWFSSGVIGVWKSICPLLKGIGYAICMISYLCCIYYIVILAWTFYYLFMSFQAVVPWKTCDNPWNTKFCRAKRSGDLLLNCTELDLPQNCTAKPTSPSGEFWSNNVLEMTEDISDFGDMRWPLFGTFILSWIVVYFCLFKGIKSSGKVVYFTATFPFIVLFILMIRGATLEGSLDGVIYYLNPDWERLADPQVWIYAATQIYWSLGVGFGALITFGSYNKFNNNVHKDALVISIANCSTSFFAGFVVFSVLGFMAFTLDTTVAKVATSGPGLAFVAYPEAISQMPVSTLWAVLFFFMLITLGLDSQFATIEAVITAIVDEYPWVRGTKWRKPVFVLILCISLCILGMPCVFQGGMWIFNLMDYQVAGLSLLIVALLEIITIGWIYGVDRFSDDVEYMTGRRPMRWFRICWKYVSPLCTLAIILANLIQWKGVKYNGKPYPGWAELIGWMFMLSSVLMIPAFAIHEIYKRSGTLRERITFLLKPDEEALSKIMRDNGNKRAPVVYL